MSLDEKSEQLEQLLRTGQSRGYVLYEEIDQLISPGRSPEMAAELDRILTMLVMNSVDVVDEPRTEISIPGDTDLDELEQGIVGNSAPVRMYVNEVMTVPRLTAEQEKTFAQRVRAGGPDADEAADRLTEANLWIALATATHFTNRGLRFLDLIQEGNIGLMAAVKHYDHFRPYRFLTYAVWWVRRKIIVAIADASG